MKFAGVDLAWKGGKSGIAVISGERVSVLLLEDIEEIADFLAHIGEVFVGVDAPLVVDNTTGCRRADMELNKTFRHSQALCLPVNLRLLKKLYGGARGSELAAALIERGFEMNPMLRKPNTGRAFAEVFPHATLVTLFRLERILRYKPRRGRSLEMRRKEMLRYLKLLESLKEAKPRILIPEIEVGRSSKDLKRAEDLLDAITCAYTVYYCWWHGRARVFGSPGGAHILVPESLEVVR